MSEIDLSAVIRDDPSYVPQLERKSLEVDGNERFYHMFIGKAYRVANPVVYIFAPDHTDPAVFAEKSGWLEAARLEGFVAVFPENENGTWDLTGQKDLRFWEKLRDIRDIRYQPHNTRQYICGCKEGAMMAELAILRTPEFVAGMALVSPGELGQQVLENAGTQLSTEYKKYLPAFEGRDPILSRDVEQNVLVCHAPGQVPEESIRFWRQVGSGKNTWAGVQTRELPDSCLQDKSLAEEIYKNFFSKTRRYRIAPNGELRQASDYRDDPNARLRVQTFAGRQREWVEVLPVDYSQDENYPLVIGLHGSNNDGPQLYDITRLWEVAQARKFICLFPTSLRKGNKYEFWNFNKGTSKDNGNPDEEFLLGLVDLYRKEYSVDESRIYITGFSNGGGMTQAMAMKHADIFAAAMSYSGACKNPDVFPEVTEKSLLIPMWMNEGSLERFTSSLSVTSHGKQNWEYWIRRDRVNPEHYVTVDLPRQTIRIYEGSVECRYSMRKDSHHAILSEQYWQIYDEFLCRFRRGINGESIEDGYTHMARIGGTNVKLSGSMRIDGKIYVSVKEVLRLTGISLDQDDGVCLEDQGQLYVCLK